MNKKKELKKLYDEFYELNKPYWNVSCLTTTKQKNILVFVGGNLTISLVSVMLFAKKLQETNFARIIIGYTGRLHYEKKQLYKSFCVSKIIKLLKLNLFAFFRTVVYLPKIISLRDGESVLKMKIDSDSVPVGEEIYDWLIHSSRMLTVNRLTLKSRVKILIYIYSYFCFLNLTKKENIQTFIFSDCDYINSAFSKVCQKKGLEMFNPVDLRGYIIKHNEVEDFKMLSPNFITCSRFKKISSMTDFQQLVQETMKKHFEGSEEYLGSMAFRNKRLYSKTDLLNSFGLKDERKLVVVASHVFSDVPRYSYDMIFRDYYDWLLRTIEILSRTDKYHVFVKEHPSSSWYGEEGSLDGILKTMGVSNIHAIPSDLSTRSLFDFADCFVTCCGTIGLEASCFGLPVVTASKGYYYGYGLDYNCSDYESYKFCLENLEQLKRRPEKIELAKKLLTVAIYGFELHPVGFMQNLSSIGDSFCDDYIVMKKLNDAIKQTSPKDEFYDSQLDNIIIFDDRCIPKFVEQNLERL